MTNLTPAAWGAPPEWRCELSGQISLLADAKLFELSPLHVDEGVRIGFLHEDKAAALGRLMAVDGQRDPIKVVANRGNEDQPWRLVTGMHRLIGARIEGITVFAIEVSGTPEDLADLEASENLHRRPLAPIERAKFTAALVAAAQDRIARERGGLKQQQMAVKARWDRVKHGEALAEKALKDDVEYAVQGLQRVYDWEESVSDALGMSKRSIHYDLSLFRLIIEPFPDLIEALARHPVVGENGAQLKAIAAIRDEARRREVIELLLADAELSADDARVQAGIDAQAGPAPAPYQKHFDAISSGWSRLGTAEKRRFLPTLAQMLTPDMKRELRDTITAELGDEQVGPKPAVPVHASVKPDYIVCLEDGTRHTNLAAKIARLGMTPADYRARWGLSFDYPMLAPNYSDRRRREWRARVLARRQETTHAR